MISKDSGSTRCTLSSSAAGNAITYPLASVASVSIYKIPPVIVQASADGAWKSISSPSAAIPLHAKRYVSPICVGIGITYSSLAVAVDGIKFNLPAEVAFAIVTLAAGVSTKGDIPSRMLREVTQNQSDVDNLNPAPGTGTSGAGGMNTFTGIGNQAVGTFLLQGQGIGYASGAFLTAHGSIQTNATDEGFDRFTVA